MILTAWSEGTAEMKRVGKSMRTQPASTQVAMGSAKILRRVPFNPPALPWRRAQALPEKKHYP